MRQRTKRHSEPLASCHEIRIVNDKMKLSFCNWGAFMTENYDGGIVEGYLTEFKQLGTKAQAGEDVADRLLMLLQKARGHLAIWKDGDPEKNKARLVGRLRITADLAAHSAPEFARTLMSAARDLDCAGKEPRTSAN